MISVSTATGTMGGNRRRNVGSSRALLLVVFFIATGAMGRRVLESIRLLKPMEGQVFNDEASFVIDYKLDWREMEEEEQPLVAESAPKQVSDTVRVGIYHFCDPLLS